MPQVLKPSLGGGHAVSDLDVRALEVNFENWRTERAPNLDRGEAFEHYVVEQILKDAQLSDEEIESGILGGGDDGGVDGMYFFINRMLMLDDTDVPDPALDAQLVLVQAKFEKGFGETPVEKLHAFTRDLLNYSKPVSSFTYLNTYARDAMARFRDKYNTILGSPHNLKISFYYATKSDQAPNPKVVKRADNLKEYVKGQISAAHVDVEFWGCERLLAVARTRPSSLMTLDISKHFTTDDGSVVCLVKLKSFARFLTDERGAIRRALFEPNVRDYQGKRNPVNADIRDTLANANGGGTEFWWLNNGITVLASSCAITGNTLTINSPEIVNGLQTSHEIFTYFTENPGRDDTRNVLVRVIVPPEEQTRNRITKATNYQTEVNPVFLHATEPIHFDIEERFKRYDLFYDRRKGHYRNLRKPISRIISIHDLARAVIAILLREPNNARGGPQKLLNNDAVYKTIFGHNYNRDMFVTCVLLDRQVTEYLNGRSDLSKDERRDVRYYVDLLVACELTQKARPNVQELAALVQTLVNPLPLTTIEAATTEALVAYRALGGTDKIAKGLDLIARLMDHLDKRFPVPPPPGSMGGGPVSPQP